MIAITGTSGFLGRTIARKVLGTGESIRAVGRRPPEGLDVEFHRWDSSSKLSSQAVSGCRAIVHLAGEPVGQRWSAVVKQRIRSSRVDGTRSLVEAISGAAQRPATLVCASAVGFYGDRGEEVLTEASQPGRGFLPHVCVEWENAAREAEKYGVRVVRLRIGIVLGKGGALKQMLLPFRMGVGGRLGSGRQWMSWIHVEDLIQMMLFAISETTLTGAVNAVAPEPVRNVEFTQALAAAVHRPVFLPVPKFALAVMFGEMAEVMLASVRVVPEAAMRAGFRFEFDRIAPALANAVRDK